MHPKYLVWLSKWLYRNIDPYKELLTDCSSATRCSVGHVSRDWSNCAHTQPIVSTLSKLFSNCDHSQHNVGWCCSVVIWRISRNAPRLVCRIGVFHMRACQFDQILENDGVQAIFGDSERPQETDWSNTVVVEVEVFLAYFDKIVSLSFGIFWKDVSAGWENDDLLEESIMLIPWYGF